MATEQSSPLRSTPPKGWAASAVELLAPPRLSPDDLAAYSLEQATRVTDRFRSGVPAGLLIVGVIITFVWMEEPDLSEQRRVVFASLAAAVALGSYLPLCTLAAFRDRPNRLILPISLVVAGAVAVIGSHAGGFGSIAAALALLIWIYGSVLAPLPPRTFLLDVSLQYAVITGGIWIATPPERFPWMYFTVTIGGFSLAILGTFIRENTDRRAFIARRRLDEAHAELEEKRVELERVNDELEARVEKQVHEIVKRANEVEALNVQLQQRVQERSQELAAALERLGRPEESGPRNLAPGTVVGERAKVIQLLGVGGMGEVYLAEDLLTGGRVALKVMRGSDNLDTTGMKRMLGEASAASAITHPGVVRPLHVDVSADGSLYLLTEFVRGETLSVRLDRGDVFDPGAAARVGQVLAEALAAAHGRDVVHRDVKPHNVMLTTNEPGVKLLDFGISKTANEVARTALTATGQILGTPAYMAPEQFADPGNVTAAADIYSLGLLVYACVAGRGPFVFDNPLQAIAAHTLDDAPPLAEQADQVPEALSELVSRCLAKHPSHRPSASEVAGALRQIADELDAPKAVEIAPRSEPPVPGSSPAGATTKRLHGVG